MTIQEALTQSRLSLRPISDAPDLDAERLLLFALERNNASWLYAHPEHILSPAREKQYMELIAMRKTGMPLAYILGESEFYGRRFHITPDVLIPRPDTEQIINLALPLIKELAEEKSKRLTVADAGTGSGCIGITLLLESPYVERLLAIDISEKALYIARKNAKKHGVLPWIEFMRSDMRKVLGRQDVDIIVSNPPYVPSLELDEKDGIEKRGLSFEPRIALDGGSDGEDYIRLLQQSQVPVIVEGVGGKAYRLI